jgi:3D (Asp-Asp-Asp) domain-containing protein
MPSTEEQVRYIIAKHSGRVPRGQIARELRISLGYLDLICEGLKRKGEISRAPSSYLRGEMPAYLWLKGLGITSPLYALTALAIFLTLAGVVLAQAEGWPRAQTRAAFINKGPPQRSPMPPASDEVEQPIGKQEAAAVTKTEEADAHQPSKRTPKTVRRAIVTFYSSDSWQTDETPFITASGARVRDGIAAANFLGFGTQIKLPELYGDKTFIIEDRLHPRFSDRIDIWVGTREEAVKKGIHHTKLEIY